MKGYHSELEDTLEVKEVNEDDDDNNTNNLQDDFDSGGEQVAFLGYTVAKVPAYRSDYLSDLVDQYGANDIISQLTNALLLLHDLPNSHHLPLQFLCINVSLFVFPQHLRFQWWSPRTWFVHVQQLQHGVSSQQCPLNLIRCWLGSLQRRRKLSIHLMVRISILFCARMWHHAH